MNRRSFSIIIVVIMLLTINTTAFAATEPEFTTSWWWWWWGGGGDNGGDDQYYGDDECSSCASNTDNAAPDPGVSSGQDETKTSTIKWVLPHGDTFIIDDEEVNIVLDWESLDITSERDAGNGSVTFIGIGGSGDDNSSSCSSCFCGHGNGRGNCNGNGNGSGNGNGNGNGGGGLPTSDCGSVWVTPGNISVNASQIAPKNAVVINQDPDENGVTIEWNISISPTTVSYEKWKIVGHRMVACVENDHGNRNGSGHDDDPDGEQNRYGCGHNNCGCPNGWGPVIEHIWACQVTEKTYKESIDTLVAGRILDIGFKELDQW